LPRLIKISVLLILVVLFSNPVSAIVVSSNDCKITVSHNSGFYAEQFELQIETDEGCEIYYTLDSTSPIEFGELLNSNILLEPSSNGTPTLAYITEISHAGAPWREPIGDIQMATVLRVVAKDPDANYGDEQTFTYFIGLEYATPPGIPVVSLVFDQEHFFDHETGIYVLGQIFENWQTQNPTRIPDGGTPANYFQSGVEWERPSHFKYFDEQGNVALSQNIGVRIHGGWSRQFAQKSLRLYSRSDYGVSRFRYRFFETTEQDNHNRLILRNSGQDWDRTKLLDMYQASLLSHLQTATQAYQPVLVYLNGEYWGLYNLRERIDQHYLETYYGIDRDEIDIVEITGIPNHGTNEAFYEMLNFFIETDLSIEENYQKALQFIDVNSFIDHYVTQIYGANTDWPGANQRMWRKQTDGFQPTSVYGHDGRWYWMIFDQDFGFLRTPDFNALEYATQPEITRFMPHVTVLIRKMLENENFKNEFIIRFMNQINTSYAPRIATQKLDEISSLIEPFIPQNYRRWDSYDVSLNRSRDLDDWKALIENIRFFAQHRPEFMIQHLIDYFELEENLITLTLDTYYKDQGTISLNSLVLSENIPNVDPSVFPYEARHFKGLTYTAIAVPQPGYQFVKWTGDIVSNEIDISFTPDSNLYIHAEFEQAEITEPENLPNVDSHKLFDGEFRFEYWSPDQPERSYPESMYFTQSEMDDPKLEDPVDEMYFIPENDYASGDVVGFPYNNSSRTRINGLGENGISFINTGRGRDVGAAVVTLDATDTEHISVQWTAGTLRPNFRTYNIRLQVRSDPDGNWHDVLSDQGFPIEYQRNDVEGHTEDFGPHFLPDSLNGLSFIQLRWKYYFTGVRLSGDGGQRDMLRLDDIIVRASRSTNISEPETIPKHFTIAQNYPNPFNNGTVITYNIPTEGYVQVKVFDILGRQLNTVFDGIQVRGTHNIRFNVDMLSSGVYIYSVEFEGARLVGKMTIAR
jgi:hypothetical protein